MRRTGAMTLLETVFTTAILVGALLAVLSLIATSLRASRQSKPNLLAQQAARAVADELRADAGSLALVYGKYWGAPAPTAPGIVVRGDGTPQVHMDFDNVGTIFSTILDPAVTARVMRRHSDGGAFIRVKLLSEAAYNALWANPAGASDLNFNGTTDDALEREGPGITSGPDYRILPVSIEIRWQDESGDRVHRLVTTIATESELDPNRS